MTSSESDFNELEKRHQTMIRRNAAEQKSRTQRYTCRCNECLSYEVLRMITLGINTKSKLTGVIGLPYHRMRDILAMMVDTGLVKEWVGDKIYLYPATKYVITEKGIEYFKKLTELKQMIANLTTSDKTKED